MSEPVSSAAPAGQRVTAAALAANLRVLSVRLGGEGQEQGVELLGRVNQIVDLFIEKHWRAPRRSARLRAMSFLLLPAADDPTFEDDVEALTRQLERHLFGEGVEIKCLVGDAAGIENIAAGPEESFITAHAAESERKAKVEEKEAAPAPRVLTDREQALPGQMRLFAGYDAQRSAVLCYVASLGVGEPAVPASYDDVARHAGVRIEVFETAALRFVADKVAERIQAGAVGYCLTPLSYETLADRKRREAYLAVAAALPDAHRRYILPSVFGGPTSPATNFLVEIIGALRQGGFAGVDWQTPSCAVHLEALKHAGVFAVTLSPPKTAWERKIELARLPAFVRRLSTLRIRAGVTGLATQAEVEEAIVARAHYLSGPAISAEMPSLAPRLDLALGELPLAAAA